MAGKCLDKLPHTCGTRSGLQVFEADDGTVNGFCFSCQTFIRHPYGKERLASDLPKPKVKSAEEIAEEIDEISKYKTIDVPQKKLRKDALEYFGVKVAVSEEDGKTPTMLCYPYYEGNHLFGYKVKTLGTKNIWFVGSFRGHNPKFWGWNQAVTSGAKRLIITEGEDDAIAWRRVLTMYSKAEYKDFTAVVSLPSGSSSAKASIMKNLKEINQYFGEVYLSFDMDEPGRKAVEEVTKFCPNFKDLHIPAKDANQCVIDGKAKALYSALFNAKEVKNTRLVLAKDIADEAMEPPKWGELTWPWDHLNDATRGIRYGETIYLGAGVKMGKSELVNALAAHFIKEHDIKVLMAKPEEENKHSVKLLAGKIVGKIFHDPKKEFDKDAFKKAIDVIDDKAILLDIYQHLGWNTLKEDIIAAINIGVKAIFIDPITNLTSGMDSGEANIRLEQIAKECSVIAKDHNVAIFLFCHLKAHEGSISRDKREKEYEKGKYIGLGNCPHEWGGDIYSNQFAGSRAMMRSCNMMLGLEGNKDPELPDNVSNIRQIKILEDRSFGTSGIFQIYWDSETSLFKSI